MKKTVKWVKSHLWIPLPPCLPPSQTTALVPERLARLLEKVSSSSAEGRKHPAALTSVGEISTLSKNKSRCHVWPETIHCRVRFFFSKDTPWECIIWTKTIICSLHQLWSSFKCGSQFPRHRLPFVLSVSFFVLCLCPTSPSCYYSNHNFCPLVLFFFVGRCPVLCALCNTWRPQQECKCAYARYSTDYMSL